MHQSRQGVCQVAEGGEVMKKWLIIFAVLFGIGFIAGYYMA